MAEKRSAFLLFLNTTPSEETATYALVGDGVTELTVAYNPQTTTEQFIHQDVATTEVTGYQPNAPVTAQVVKGDAAFEYVNSLRKTLPVLSGACTDVVMFDAFDTEKEGAYPAVRQPVAVQIDSYGGAASDPLSVSYTLSWRGEAVEGTFNPTTKTFTEGKA